MTFEPLLNDALDAARGDRPCGRCGDDHHGPQKAIIGVSVHSHAATIVWSTPALACDLREACIEADDIWDLSKHQGLLVWEGRMVWFTNGGPEGCDGDMAYKGGFRPLHDDEWALLRGMPEELRASHDGEEEVAS